MFLISQIDLCHFEASAATKKLEMGVANQVIFVIGCWHEILEGDVASAEKE